MAASSERSTSAPATSLAGAARRRFWASPLHAAGRLYFFNDAGTTYVAEAGRSWKKLAENKLDDGCMASPAVAGQALFIRTKTHLYRIEEKK